MGASSSGDGGVSIVSGGGGPAPTHPLESKTEQYIIRAQSFDVSANGLKPLTQHFFFYEGANATDRCKPLGGNRGDGLITDNSGALSFTVYVDPTTIVPSTGYEQAESLISNFAIAKQVRITSAPDGSQQDSYCDSSIGVVTTQEVTTTTPDAIINVVETPYVAPVVPVVGFQGGRQAIGVGSVSVSTIGFSGEGKFGGEPGDGGDGGGGD